MRLRLCILQCNKNIAMQYLTFNGQRTYENEDSNRRYYTNLHKESLMCPLSQSD